MSTIEELAREHGDALVAFAYVLSGNAAQADDLVQGALLRMLKRGTRPPEHPVAYARRAIVNLYLDEHRRGLRRSKVLTLLRASVNESEDQAVGVTQRQALLDAVNVLQPKERAAIVLRYYADQDDDSIAEYLGCSRATVRSLVHRAVPKLRAQLVPDGDGSPHEPEGFAIRPTRNQR